MTRARSGARPLSRRRFLGTLAATPLITACSSPSPAVPTLTGRLSSRFTGSRHDWVVWYPAGTPTGADLPVAIVLHGLGDSIHTADRMHYPEHLADVVRDGAAPFALAAIDGGSLYWQKIGSQDAGALVAEEFVALLATQGLDTSRLGLTGWSMGGWGTLRLASQDLQGRLRAVAALSTPCYERFDSLPTQEAVTRAQFDANNFVPHPERLADLPILLACGRSDTFFPGNESFAEVLRATPGVPEPTTLFAAGDHSQTFWESVAPAQLRFLAERL
ncbi:alpha/beta hydrolase [Propionicicella superfundia]|uniref:alpha/beta hydrolase n=1 Tax=Propionicicella superfundia TaxID=348582 RepID=UPI00041B44D7|nr:alpha/beta hydrolase [Propionicicella superfundia]